MTKEIKINWKNEVFTVLVDDDSYSLLARHTWYIMFSGPKKKPYAFAELYSKPKGGKRVKRMFYMHQMVTGSFSQVDHDNHDTLDNQFENLRPATYQENGWNSIKRQVTCTGKPPSSQYKGVTKLTRRDGTTYWRVIVKISKKYETPTRFVRLGPFDTEDDAARGYDEEIVKHRGKWALLNFPPLAA
jgi:hypothetical protein